MHRGDAVKIQLPVELYNILVQTLAERPYKEVFMLLARMDQERVVIQDDETEEQATSEPKKRRR